MVDRVVEREEPLVRGLEKQGGGEGLGDAAYPVVHVGRHRLPGSAVRHPQGAHPRVLGGLHRGHHPRRIALFERLLQRRVQIGLGYLLATPGGVFTRADSSWLPSPRYNRPNQEEPARLREEPERAAFHIDRRMLRMNKRNSFKSASDLYTRTGRNPAPPCAPTLPNATYAKLTTLAEKPRYPDPTAGPL